MGQSIETSKPLDCGCDSPDACYAQRKEGFILDLVLGRHRRMTDLETAFQNAARLTEDVIRWLRDVPPSAGLVPDLIKVSEPQDPNSFAPTELDERASFQALCRARNAALERAQMISFGFCHPELIEDNIISEAELRGMGWVQHDDGWRAPDKFPAERNPTHGEGGHYQISTDDVRKLGEGDLIRGAAVVRSALMAILPDRTELPPRRLDEFFHGAPSTATNSGPVEIPVTPETDFDTGPLRGRFPAPFGMQNVYGSVDISNNDISTELALGSLIRPHPRPECVTDWVPAELYTSVVAERDRLRSDAAMRAAYPPVTVLRQDIQDIMAEHAAMVEGIDVLRESLEAKDARIAELKSELALRPGVVVDPTPDTAKPSPFRDFRGDPRRMGPL